MSFTDKYLQTYKGNRFLGHIHRILLSLLIFIFPKWIYKYYIHSRHYDFEISFNYLYTSYLVAHSPNSSSKKIMWFHGSIYDLEWKNYHGIKRYIYKALFKMQKNALKKADHIVPISINTKKSIEKLFPFSHPKITMINNGYNFNHIEILSKEPVSIPKRKEYRLISIGRLDQNKNVMLQLEALSILKKNNSQIELIIIGEPARCRLPRAWRSTPARTAFRIFPESQCFPVRFPRKSPAARRLRRSRPAPSCRRGSRYRPAV